MYDSYYIKICRVRLHHDSLGAKRTAGVEPMCRTQSNTTRQELCNSNRRRSESGERNTRLTSCPLALLELSFDIACSDCCCHCLIGCLKETPISDGKLQEIEKNDVIDASSENTSTKIFPIDFI